MFKKYWIVRIGWNGGKGFLLFLNWELGMSLTCFCRYYQSIFYSILWKPSFQSCYNYTHSFIHRCLQCASLCIWVLDIQQRTRQTRLLPLWMLDSSWRSQIKKKKQIKNCNWNVLVLWGKSMETQYSVIWVKRGINIA